MNSLKYEFLATLRAAEWFLSIVDSFLSHCNLSYYAQKHIADMVKQRRVTTYMLTL